MVEDIKRKQQQQQHKQYNIYYKHILYTIKCLCINCHINTENGYEFWLAGLVQRLVWVRAR